MIEQGYPGGPRPEGAHRAVLCGHCGQPEARRTLVARVNRTLAELMRERTETGEPMIKYILEREPELVDRLRKAFNL